VQEFEDQFLYTVVLALALAALAALSAWGLSILMRRRGRPAELPAWAGALLSLLIVVIPGTVSVLAWLPREESIGLLKLTLSSDWQALVYLAPACGIVGLVLSLSLPKRWWADLTAGILIAVVATLVIWPIVEPDGWQRRLTPGVLTAALYFVLNPFARRTRAAPTLALCLWIGAFAAGVATLFVMGQRQPAAVLAPVGASLVVLAAVARGRFSDLSGGALAGCVSVLVASPATAWLYASAVGVSFPLGLVLVTSLSPACAWAASLPRVRSWSAWKRTGLAVTLTALIAGGVIATMIVLDQAQGEDDPLMQMYG